ncbi:procathepsin L-like [Ruditapes philippinarum]|uniref:procathepsin L-like n=1 Tax=Ruditapes philippinarum TaxID=129788 RepID=UPI00295ABCAA|nr:procathepsin L-like [Ruditapes philippinarum]
MLMKCTFLLLVLTSVVMSLDLQEIDKEWNTFKAKYNRSYNTRGEEHYRYSVFTQNFKTIYFHNKAADLGGYTYWLGVNQFADMTSKEFKGSYANLKLDSSHIQTNTSHKRRAKRWDNVYPLPEEVDWRDQDCVTEVKDQGQCCSCYAFAAVGALESHTCLKFPNKAAEPLSEQNILDCSKPLGNHGCDNGNPFMALKYAMEKGLDTEASYPYRGKVGECNQSQGRLGSWVEDIEMIWTHGDIESLKEAVAIEGPVVVSIDTDDDADTFRLYSNGVYNNPKCKNEIIDLDHALLLVGYGITDEDQPYWLLKNSYGVDWGEEGYLRMIRKEDENTCGIATFAMYPTL